MKEIFYRTWLISAGLALLAACSSTTPPTSETASGVTQLFTLEPTPDRNTLQKSATGYLASLLADPANQEITLVKVDPAVVSINTQDLAVTLPNGKTAQFHLRDYNTITPGIDGWVGYKPSAWKQAHPSSVSEIDIDPLYYLSLARDGEKLVGSATVEGQPYRIEYVSPGQHALIKVDETKLPLEGPPLQAPGAAARDDTIGKVPESTRSIIRVLFVTTKQIRNKEPNNRVQLANALNDANQYMKNSRVAITYELAGYFDADYDETGRTYKQQLDDIRLAKPFGEQVLQLRESMRADLVSMYSSDQTLCGKAWLTASRLQAHSVITCTSSLGHELGHNLGASHNWEPGDSEGKPPYMYGYRYTGTPRFRTQMSYDCSGGACPRTPYHSNPRLTYAGVPLGTAEHHDVARRFNERRETVAAFYPDPQSELILTLRGQNRSCVLRLSPGSNVQLSWYLQCKDPQPFNPESAVVSGLYGANTQRKLCFANTLYTTNSCYSGFHNGSEFTIKNIHQGTGRPNTLEFSRRLMGAVTRITYD